MKLFPQDHPLALLHVVRTEGRDVLGETLPSLCPAAQIGESHVHFLYLYPLWVIFSFWLVTQGY